MRSFLNDGKKVLVAAGLSLALFWLLAWPAVLVQAQSCSHVIFRLEADVNLDQTAVCQAAQDWADQGFQIFVYVSDAATGSEDEWFGLLDQAETEVGLRNGSNFEANVLAFETSMGGEPWAATITYGGNLFDSRLDQNENRRLEIANNLQSDILNDNVTEGFVTAISESYAFNYPPASSGGLGVATAVAGLAAVGAAAAGGYVLNKQVLQPARARRKQQEALQAHLAVLQQNVANLLLASERLLKGDTAQETVLFQVFEAYGGNHYADRTTAVTEWLRRSQAALNAAFDLRRQLLSEDVQQRQTLEEQIRSWEMIYLTLVGSSKRVLELTDDELHDLLDPMITLERKEQDTPLVKQLVDLQRELKGMPLKVELKQVDPDTVEHEGILGYIDQVEQQLTDLMTAQTKAPEALEAARRDRLQAEEDGDSARPFGLTGSQMLSGVDERLAQARRDLEGGIYLRVLEQTAVVQRDLAIVADATSADAEQTDAEKRIVAILEEGYRPVLRETQAQKIAAFRQHIIDALTAGDYLAADNWIDEFDAASDETLRYATQWREQHQFNQASLQRMAAEVARLEAYLAEEATPAWNQLQSYPRGNWESVMPGVTEPTQTLQEIHQRALPHITTLNSMATQQFPEAEQALVAEGARLMQAERQLQTAVDRLAEVQTAEAHIADGLRLAKEDWQKGVALRDTEDPKIGPEIDHMLAEARDSLQQAESFARAREFIAATLAQTKARHLATEAFASASEQVQRINALQTELETVGQQVSAHVSQVLAAGDGLPAVVLTPSINQQLQTLARQLSQAKQARAAIMSQEDHALAAALQTAVAAFNSAGQLATETQKAIQTEARNYQELVTQAANEIRQAEEAVAAASQKINQPDGSDGRFALQRAIEAIPTQRDLAQLPKETLKQVAAQAQQARQYAQEAERKADEGIRQARQQREQRSGWGGGPFGGGPVIMVPGGRSQSGGGWGSPGLPRSSNRGSSSGMGSRRISSSGGSHRTSSRGGSRR